MFNQKGSVALSLIIIGVLLLSIPAGVYLTQRTQIFKSRANTCTELVRHETVCQKKEQCGTKQECGKHLVPYETDECEEGQVEYICPSGEYDEEGNCLDPDGYPQCNQFRIDHREEDNPNDCYDVRDPDNCWEVDDESNCEQKPIYEEVPCPEEPSDVSEPEEDDPDNPVQDIIADVGSSIGVCKWEFDHNECTGCREARRVERNSCTQDTDIKAYGVEDEECKGSQWCGQQAVGGDADAGQGQTQCHDPNQFPDDYNEFVGCAGCEQEIWQCPGTNQTHNFGDTSDHRCTGSQYCGGGQQGQLPSQSTICTYSGAPRDCPGEGTRTCTGTDEGQGCHYNSNVDPNCQESCNVVPAQEQSNQSQLPSQQQPPQQDQQAPDQRQSETQSCREDGDFSQFVGCNTRQCGKEIWRCPATGQSRDDFDSPEDGGCRTEQMNPACRQPKSEPRTPSKPVVSTTGTQITSVPVKKEVICEARAYCNDKWDPENGENLLDGTAIMGWFREDGSGTKDCPPNEQVYAPQHCPPGGYPGLSVLTGQSKISQGTSLVEVIEKTAAVCTYQQDSIEYDCSRGFRCWNDFYADSTTFCQWKPKDPHFHCDVDDSCFTEEDKAKIEAKEASVGTTNYNGESICQDVNYCDADYSMVITNTCFPDTDAIRKANYSSCLPTELQAVDPNVRLQQQIVADQEAQKLAKEEARRQGTLGLGRVIGGASDFLRDGLGGFWQDITGQSDKSKMCSDYHNPLSEKSLIPQNEWPDICKPLISGQTISNLVSSFITDRQIEQEKFASIPPECFDAVNVGGYIVKKTAACAAYDKKEELPSQQKIDKAIQTALQAKTNRNEEGAVIPDINEGLKLYGIDLNDPRAYGDLGERSDQSLSAVMTRIKVEEIAENMGLEMGEFEKWSDFQRKAFFEQVSRVHINVAKATVEALIYPVTAHETYAAAEDFCVEKLGRGCTLKPDVPRSYEQLTKNDVTKLNELLVQQPGYREFQPPPPEIMTQYFQLLNAQRGSIGAQILNGLLDDQAIANSLNNMPGSNVKVTVEEVANIKRAYEAYGNASNFIRTRTQEGQYLKKAEETFNNELVLALATSAIDPLAVPVGIAKGVLISGKLTKGAAEKLAIKWGARSNQVVDIAARALQKEARGEVLSGAERGAIMQVADAQRAVDFDELAPSGTTLEPSFPRGPSTQAIPDSHSLADDVLIETADEALERELIATLPPQVTPDDPAVREALQEMIDNSQDGATHLPGGSTLDTDAVVIADSNISAVAPAPETPLAAVTKIAQNVADGASEVVEVVEDTFNRLLGRARKTEPETPTPEGTAIQRARELQRRRQQNQVAPTEDVGRALQDTADELDGQAPTAGSEIADQARKDPNVKEDGEVSVNVGDDGRVVEDPKPGERIHQITAKVDETPSGPVITEVTVPVNAPDDLAQNIAEDLASRQNGHAPAIVDGPNTPEPSLVNRVQQAVGIGQDEIQESRIVYSENTRSSSKHPDRNEDAVLQDPKSGTAMILDGMGGHANGDKASATGRDYLAERIGAITDNNPEVVRSRIEEVLVDASEKISTEVPGGGSTASVVKIVENDGKTYAVVGNVGDSRVYIFRDGKLRQITTDDSSFAKGVADELDEVTDLNTLSPDGRVGFNFRNVVGDALGLKGRDVKPQTHIIELQPGDRILLTSDGVHDNLTRTEIETILKGNKDDAGSKLIDSAYNRSQDKSHIRSKADDISAIVIEVPAKQGSIVDAVQNAANGVREGVEQVATRARETVDNALDNLTGGAAREVEAPVARVENIQAVNRLRESLTQQVQRDPSLTKSWTPDAIKDALRRAGFQGTDQELELQVKLIGQDINRTAQQVIREQDSQIASSVKNDFLRSVENRSLTPDGINLNQIAQRLEADGFQGTSLELERTARTINDELSYQFKLLFRPLIEAQDAEELIGMVQKRGSVRLQNGDDITAARLQSMIEDVRSGRAEVSGLQLDPEIKDTLRSILRREAEVVQRRVEGSGSFEQLYYDLERSRGFIAENGERAYSSRELISIIDNIRVGQESIRKLPENLRPTIDKLLRQDARRLEENIYQAGSLDELQSVLTRQRGLFKENGDFVSSSSLYNLIDAARRDPRILDSIPREAGLRQKVAQLLEREPCPIRFGFVPVAFAQSDIPNPCSGNPVVDILQNGAKGLDEAIRTIGESISGSVTQLRGVLRRGKPEPYINPEADAILARLTKVEKKPLQVSEGQLSIVTGIDPGIGRRFYVEPGQNLPKSVRIFDTVGREIDLAKSPSPIRTKDIGKVLIDGKEYKIYIDVWQNPFLSEPIVPQINTVFKGELENIANVWEAALKNPEQVDQILQGVLDAGSYQEIKQIAQVAKDNPEFRLFPSAKFNPWEFASLTTEEKARFLENIGPYPFPGSQTLQRLIKLSEKIETGQPLMEEEIMFIKAFQYKDIALRKASGFKAGARVSELTEPYVLANLGEHYILAKMVPMEAFDAHIEVFADFMQLMEQRGVKLPRWFNSYRRDEFRYHIRYEGHPVANVGGNYFLSHQADSVEEVAAIVTHERVHVLDHAADDITKNYQKAEGFDSYEVFTDTLANLMRYKGDVEKALAYNSRSISAYRTGNEELLKIVREVNQHSGDPLLGTELLARGILDKSEGKTRRLVEPIENYYNQNLTRDGQSFALRMGRFDEKKMVVGVSPGETSEVGDVIEVVQEPLSMAEIERALRSLPDERFRGFRTYLSDEERRAVVNEKIQFMIDHPTFEVYSQYSDELDDILYQGIISDPAASKELQAHINRYYERYVREIRGKIDEVDRDLEKLSAVSQERVSATIDTPPCPLGFNLIPVAYAQGIAPCPFPRLSSNPVVATIQKGANGVANRADNVVSTVGDGINRVKEIFIQGDRQLDKINLVEKAIREKKVTPGVEDFWRSLVRDTNGRYAKYADLNSEDYHPLLISTNQLDLTDPYALDYFQHSLDARKEFIKGIKDRKFEGSIDDFKSWLSELHSKQAYKGHPGIVRTQAGNGFSMGQVAGKEFDSLAQRDSDPLSTFLSNPDKTEAVHYLDLPGISREGRPSNTFTYLGDIAHNYPDPQYFNEYLTQMQNRLIQLDGLGLDASIEEQIRLITEFYQYAINSRMFEEVNNSLFMNMVNGLLIERGLRPIEHGILDFAAFSLQPATFQKIFIDEVKRAQPGNILTLPNTSSGLLETFKDRIMTTFNPPPTLNPQRISSIDYELSFQANSSLEIARLVRREMVEVVDQNGKRSLKEATSAKTKLHFDEQGNVVSQSGKYELEIYWNKTSPSRRGKLIIDGINIPKDLPENIENDLRQAIKQLNGEEYKDVLVVRRYEPAKEMLPKSEGEGKVTQLEPCPIPVRVQTFLLIPIAEAAEPCLPTQPKMTSDEVIQALVKSFSESKAELTPEFVKDRLKRLGFSDEEAEVLTPKIVSEVAGYKRNNPYLGLSETELKAESRKVSDQMYEAFLTESEYREGLLQDIAPARHPPVVLAKEDLNTERLYPITLNSKDQIEVRIELEGRESVPYIRNKTIADGPKLIPPAGVFEQGSLDDARRFVASLDPTKISVSKFDHVIQGLEKNIDREKLFVFKREDGNIGGIAYITDNGDYAYLAILATNPLYQREGIGSAILSGLKSRFESIRLNPVPFNKDLNISVDEAYDNLRRFYKQNGFVGSDHWSTSIISLDDLTRAGEWQKVNPEKTYGIGIDQHTITPNDVERAYLNRLLSDSSETSGLPEDILERLKLWEEAQGQYDKFNQELARVQYARAEVRKSASVSEINPCPLGFEIIPTAFAADSPCPFPNPESGVVGGAQRIINRSVNLLDTGLNRIRNLLPFLGKNNELVNKEISIVIEGGVEVAEAATLPEQLRNAGRTASSINSLLHQEVGLSPYGELNANFVRFRGKVGDKLLLGTIHENTPAERALIDDFVEDVVANKIDTVYVEQGGKDASDDLMLWLADKGYLDPEKAELNGELDYLSGKLRERGIKVINMDMAGNPSALPFALERYGWVKTIKDLNQSLLVTNYYTQGKYGFDKEKIPEIITRLLKEAGSDISEDEVRIVTSGRVLNPTELFTDEEREAYMLTQIGGDNYAIAAHTAHTSALAERLFGSQELEDVRFFIDSDKASRVVNLSKSAQNTKIDPKEFLRLLKERNPQYDYSEYTEEQLRKAVEWAEGVNRDPTTLNPAQIQLAQGISVEESLALVKAPQILIDQRYETLLDRAEALDPVLLPTVPAYYHATSDLETAESIFQDGLYASTTDGLNGVAIGLRNSNAAFSLEQQADILDSNIKSLSDTHKGFNFAVIVRLPSSDPKQYIEKLPQSVGYPRTYDGVVPTQYIYGVLNVDTGEFIPNPKYKISYIDSLIYLSLLMNEQNIFNRDNGIYYLS